MARNCITAIRMQARHYGLKGSYKLTALELAHRMSSAGVGRVSYRFLAWKTGLSVRTMIRHIARLVDLGLITKHVQRVLVHGKLVYGWNQYRLCLPVDIQSRTAPSQGGSDKVASTLPGDKTATESNATQERTEGLQEQIRKLEKGLRLFAMPGEARERVEQELARLKALLPEVPR